MTRTTAIVVRAPGGPEVLEPSEIDVPPPAAGEVRVRHSAIGVDFLDVYFRNGLYAGGAFPLVPGAQGAGVVAALGPGVTAMRVGDRVAYVTQPIGSYCVERNLPADRLVALPRAIGEEVAAAIMLKGMTARYLVKSAFRLEPGHVAVVHAAAGGAGSLLVQWAKHLGAKVIGVVSTEAKADFARRLGCDDVAQGVAALPAAVARVSGGKGANVVYDSVGKDSFATSLDVLAPRGTVVTFGQASGVVPPVDLLVLSKKSLTITRPSLWHYIATRAELEASAKDLFELVEQGVLKVTISKRYPLVEAARAHRDLESRQTTGALVLVP